MTNGNSKRRLTKSQANIDNAERAIEEYFTDETDDISIDDESIDFDLNEAGTVSDAETEEGTRGDAETGDEISDAEHSDENLSEGEGLSEDEELSEDEGPEEDAYKGKHWREDGEPEASEYADDESVQDAECSDASDETSDTEDLIDETASEAATEAEADEAATAEEAEADEAVVPVEGSGEGKAPTAEEEPVSEEAFSEDEAAPEAGTALLDEIAPLDETEEAEDEEAESASEDEGAAKDEDASEDTSEVKPEDAAEVASEDEGTSETAADDKNPEDEYTPIEPILKDGEEGYLYPDRAFPYEWYGHYDDEPADDEGKEPADGAEDAEEREEKSAPESAEGIEESAEKVAGEEAPESAAPEEEFEGAEETDVTDAGEETPDSTKDVAETSVAAEAEEAEGTEEGDDKEADKEEAEDAGKEEAAFIEEGDASSAGKRKKLFTKKDKEGGSKRRDDEGKGKGTKWKKWVAIAAIIVVVIAGLTLKAFNTKTFAQDARIDGVKVGGLSVDKAAKKVDAEQNKIDVTVDGEKIGRVDTHFEYSIKKDLKKRMRISGIDPRLWIGSKADYTVKLKVKRGEDTTAAELQKAAPDPADITPTADAYIDLDTMAIVKEVYGQNTDYIKVAKAIAKQRNEDPRKENFSFKRSKYVALPKIKEKDLADELKFDQKYLAPGMQITTSDGGTISITPKQLSKVIQYSKKGPIYSKDGAKALADEVAGNYKRAAVTVDTIQGKKQLYNYAINSSADSEKTADSIMKAAKDGGAATLYVKEEEFKDDLGTRVEVNLSAQQVYFVSNGEVVLTSPVVTGGPGHRTPSGIYKISYKSSPATLRGTNADGSKYASAVTFWMPFNGGIGFHDASWRSEFGGDIYYSSGSHGCVNMPYGGAQSLYSRVGAGTLVFVYY